MKFPPEEMWLCPCCNHPDWCGIDTRWAAPSHLSEIMICRWCGKQFQRRYLKHDNIVQRVSRWIHHVEFDDKYSKAYPNYRHPESSPLSIRVMDYEIKLSRPWEVSFNHVNDPIAIEFTLMLGYIYIVKWIP